MRLQAAKIFWVVLLAVLFLMPLGVAAQKQTEAPPPAEVKKEQPPEVPDLADLMLQANKLSNRLAVLETKIAHGLDLNALDKSLQEIEARLAPYPAEIEQLKAAPTLDFTKIWGYKDTLLLNEEDLADITEPLTKAIRNLGAARKQWLAERKRWQEWQSVLLTDEALDDIKTTLTGAPKTIDSALLLINQQLQPLVALLQKSSSIEGNINRLIAELDGLTRAQRRALLVGRTMPMFSLAYLAQLKNLTWFDVVRGMQAIDWPKPEFYKNQGWILVLAIFAALVIIFII
jgi:hypothetical protein